MNNINWSNRLHKPVSLLQQKKTSTTCKKITKQLNIKKMASASLYVYGAGFILIVLMVIWYECRENIQSCVQFPANAPQQEAVSLEMEGIPRRVVNALTAKAWTRQTTASGRSDRRERVCIKKLDLSKSFEYLNEKLRTIYANNFKIIYLEFTPYIHLKLLKTTHLL